MRGASQCRRTTKEANRTPTSKRSASAIEDCNKAPIAGSVVRLQTRRKGGLMIDEAFPIEGGCTCWAVR